MKSGIKPKMLLPFDYNLLILVIEHAYMVCPGTFIVLFWKLKGTSVYWPWSKGIHSSKAKSPNWRWLPTLKTQFLGFVGPLGREAIGFLFARAIPWPTTRPSRYTYFDQRELCSRGVAFWTEELHLFCCCANCSSPIYLTQHYLLILFGMTGNTQVFLKE